MIYGLVAIGVYISFRVLDFPDLTVDGSFPLGAAVTAILIVNGLPPAVATCVAMVAGAGAGLMTSWLSVRWNILHLLASILTMSALYTINLRIMGRPNISLLGEQTIFTPFVTLGKSLNIASMYIMPLVLFIFALLVLLILYRFLKSEIGLAICATGANSKMAQAQGIRVGGMTMLGIALSNSIVALAGSFYTQSQGFADITLGVGTIMFGLAAVIIGETLFPVRRVFILLFSCLVGAVVYRIAVALALNSAAIGFQTSDLNLVTSLLVAAAMILPKMRKKLLQKQLWRR